MQDSSKVISEALALASGLELLSPIKVSGINGQRLGRRTGNALEFAEYRDYQPGDDVRRLDWHVFARSNQLMIKQYNEEVDPRCDIILDHSSSMSSPHSKAELALGLAAFFSAAAVNAGFSLAVWHAKDTWEKEPKPEAPLEWINTSFDTLISPGENISAFAGRLMLRGIRIIISDFLWEEPPQAMLNRLCDGARRTILIRMDFEDEAASLLNGAVSLIDAESGEARDFILDADTVKRYRDRHDKHRELWQNAAMEAGADILDIPADSFKNSKIIAMLAVNGIIGSTR